MVRLSDMIGRLGPSTFGILMPFTRDPEARKAAFRITGILQKSEFDLGDDVTRDISILVDAGIVEFKPGETLTVWFGGKVR